MVELAEEFPALAADGDGRTGARRVARRASPTSTSGTAPIIRAWTEAEIGGSEFGRLGTETLAEFSRILAGRIREADPPGLDAFVAALALVAMTERLNYYSLTDQVPIERDAMVRTLTEVTQRALFGS